MPEPQASDIAASRLPTAASTRVERCWHYALDGSAYGPTDIADLTTMAARGVVEGDTLIWREGWEAWRPLSDVPELQGVLPRRASARVEAAAPSAPRSVGSPMMLAAPNVAALRLCALRVAAALIDQLILLVPTVVAVTPVMFVMMARGMTQDKLMALTMADREWWLLFLTAWVTQWIYASICESSVLMGTIGKRACGLRVTDLSGRRLGFGRASARYWSKVLSTPLFFGYFVAVFLGGRRGLHDVVAGTQVVEAGRG
ncbi:MAG: RDD family protein [Phycisphaerales bacterium]